MNLLLTLILVVEYIDNIIFTYVIFHLDSDTYIDADRFKDSDITNNLHNAMHNG